jgi:hypothetical protein
MRSGHCGLGVPIGRGRGFGWGRERRICVTRVVCGFSACGRGEPQDPRDSRQQIAVGRTLGTERGLCGSCSVIRKHPVTTWAAASDPVSEPTR